jgi:hypothetical protein
MAKYLIEINEPHECKIDIALLSAQERLELVRACVYLERIEKMNQDISICIGKSYAEIADIYMALRNAERRKKMLETLNMDVCSGKMGLTEAKRKEKQINKRKGKNNDH